MTTKQIAVYLGKDAATVARWIEKTSRKMQEVFRKVQEAKATSKPADYDLNETCQIIEEGMGKDVADVYRTNAVNAELANKVCAPKASLLPAGVQLREMRLIYGSEEAGRRLDVILGYKAEPKPLVIEAPASGNLGKLSKAAYAVEMKERAKAEQKETAKRLNGDLFNSK